MRCRSVARSLAPFRLPGLCNARALLHVCGAYGQRARGALRVWRDRCQRVALPGITPERTMQIVGGGIVADEIMRSLNDIMILVSRF